MNSLLEREGMAGQVQCIYIDPPYGIKYGSNWQMHLHNRTVTDGKDADLTGEPEQVKAYRDTWELGIHSYLSYLRERLVVAKGLLTESGSCFVQISDENVHLVRCLMDEVFSSENFCGQVSFRKTSNLSAELLPQDSDFLLWYSRDRQSVKFRQLFVPKNYENVSEDSYGCVEFPDGSWRRLKAQEKRNPGVVGQEGRLFGLADLTSSHVSYAEPFRFNGKVFTPKARYWSTTAEGLTRLAAAGRLAVVGSTLRYRRYFNDFPAFYLGSNWIDTGTGSQTGGREYVVQTSSKVIQRCILMTTDPGDLVLDPTCGSGTTAHVAEQWGRRWITTDTSRIALNIAKTRLMTAVFPYYKLYDEAGEDIRQGFAYKTVPHVTLRSIANDEPPAEETLYDKPMEDKKKLRVSGPFTVETLQNFEPVPPEELDVAVPASGEIESFEERVFEHLKSAGVKNGIRNEQAVFTRIDRLGHAYLHAEGFYNTAKGERKAYLHIGPKFGTVSKKAASFVTIGEPDIAVQPVKGKRSEAGNKMVQVQIKGLDIYDPIKDEVKARDVHDIAYWMVDDNYDGSNFVVKQVFFCGGKKDEFAKWKKGLENLAKTSAKRQTEKTLRIEIDDDAFDRVYNHTSHPIEVTGDGKKIAVRVISQFGEESTRVIEVSAQSS